MKKREKIKELEQRIGALEKSKIEGWDFSKMNIEEITNAFAKCKTEDLSPWLKSCTTYASAFEKPKDHCEGVEYAELKERNQKTLEEYLKPSFDEGWLLCWDGEICHDTNVNQEDITIYRTEKEALLALRFQELRRVAEKCEGYGGEGCWTVYLGWDGLGCDMGDTFPFISPVRFNFPTCRQSRHFISEATRLGLNDWEQFKN